MTDFWQRLCAAGDIYKGHYTGRYCVDCEQYLTGDVGECPVHARALEHYAEDSYFFRLSRYRDRLIGHIEANPDFVRPETRRNEVLAFLRAQDLTDLSVSRTSTRWGIEVPGDPEHVLYVWVDALVSYLSALGPLDAPESAAWWAGAYHFIGKDILIFHAVVWPAMLLAAGLPLPNAIVVNGWLTITGRKIARSDPSTMFDPRIEGGRFGNAALAFCFLPTVGLGSDLDFDREDVVRTLDADLANNLGNLVSRLVKFIVRRFEGCVPAERMGELVADARDGAAQIRQALEAFETARAARQLLGELARINRHLQGSAPWREPDERRVRAAVGEAVGALAVTLNAGWPLLGALAEGALAALGSKAAPAWTGEPVVRRVEPAHLPVYARRGA
ncbi:MAG: hypothetical protein CMD83_00755 [Gammaproteobacteria bacterium]|nr:hypothetical protein [Gammaproteobacteria bacterium]